MEPTPIGLSRNCNFSYPHFQQGFHVEVGMLELAENGLVFKRLRSYHGGLQLMILFFFFLGLPFDLAFGLFYLSFWSWVKPIVGQKGEAGRVYWAEFFAFRHTSLDTSTFKSAPVS